MSDNDFDWDNSPLFTSPSSGADILSDVETFLARFVVYPGEPERVAHTLWIAHTWLMDCWDSTPRIAFLSPEPGSGKSRALEVTEPLVPRPVHAVNTTPAYLFRKVSDEDGAPTILYDEIDTVFGPKAKDNEEIRGMLNAGHRRGATSGRCVIRGKTVETEELPAYCAVALAGLDDLPDTIATRAVIVRMRRRAPGETVEPWRHRINSPEGDKLAERLSAWAGLVHQQASDTFPDIPTEITDRDADVWEALLAVADLAGGAWPERARRNAVTLVTRPRGDAGSLGVILLRDLRSVFTAAGTDKMTTESIVHGLINIEESPWGDIRGKEIDARGLSRRLNKYGVSSKTLRVGNHVFKGYDAADMADPWSRYLSDGVSTAECVVNGDGTHSPSTPALPENAVTSVTQLQLSGDRNPVTDVTDVPENRPSFWGAVERAPDADICQMCSKPYAPNGQVVCDACDAEIRDAS